MTVIVPYDMNRAVILSLAGGFPTGCGAAYSDMVKRITSVPPKPLFGFCPMGTLSETDFPNNDDPGVARTLRSVRAEVARSYFRCGRDQEYFCTSMIEMNGDRSDLYMGTRRGDRSNPWRRRGKRVTLTDFKGNDRSMGDVVRLGGALYVVVQAEHLLRLNTVVLVPVLAVEQAPPLRDLTVDVEIDGHPWRIRAHMPLTVDARSVVRASVVARLSPDEGQKVMDALNTILRGL